MPKKKTKKKKVEKKEKFFVGVHSPIEVRKALLESSRDSIQLLQRYQRLKELREEKLKHVEQLKKVLKRIQVLSTRLNNLLPKSGIRVELEKEKIVEKKKVEEKEAEPVKKNMTEIDQLEAELRSVEGKLDRLD